MIFYVVNLFIFPFMICTSCILFKKNIVPLGIVTNIFANIAFQKILRFPFTFKSLIHLKFTFVYSVLQGYKLIHFYALISIALY